MSLIDPNHPTHRVRRALGLKTILGSDYPGEPFPDLPEELRPFLPETSRIGIYPSELQSGPESSSRNEAPHGAPETERVDELKRRFLKPFGDDPRNMGGSAPPPLVPRRGAALLAHQPLTGNPALKPNAIEAASAGEPPSVTVPLPDEKIRRQIEKGEQAISHLGEIIEHQKEQLAFLEKRSETEPGPIGLPDGFFKVPGIFLNFVRIINAAIVFLSIADRLDRAITNPRTIEAFRESIPRLIDVRDKFIDRVGELRGELNKIT